MKLSGMRSLAELRSMSRSVSGSAKAFPMASVSSSGPISMGSFANLKLTAEKLVKEQASTKTELELANMKLKKSVEHIHALENKLQNVVNENATLKVKGKEDAELWNGLECKMSSTKALCDQLTETLHQLACQVQDAEKDKKLFEDKLSASSSAFEKLHLQMTNLSADLMSAEENIRKSEQEVMKLRIEAEEKEKRFVDECCRSTNIISEKDVLIKELDETVAKDKQFMKSLNARLEEVQHQLSLKEEICKCLTATQENLEKEKGDLQSRNEHFAKTLQASGQQIKDLEDLIQSLIEKLIDLDNYSKMVSNDVFRLNSTFDTCNNLFQQEKVLIAKCAQSQFGRLRDQFMNVTSENEALKSENEELKNKVTELQKVQEFMMVQHAEECQLAEEKTRKLESEAEILVSKTAESEALITKLEEKIKHLSETSCLSENKMRDLLQKFASLESEKQEVQDKLQLKLQDKIEESETLRKEISKHEQNVDLLEQQIKELHDSMEAKEQLLLQFKNTEEQLQDQKNETQASLAALQSELAEAKKQHNLMLESKQLELTKHLKEISQRNDQAINDIRRKFELERLEIVNKEKEKADKLLGDMEKSFDQKLAEDKEESKRCLMRAQEEHVSLINDIQESHDKKIKDLKANHDEELKTIQLQAEEKLRENTVLLRKEHEVQMRSLKQQLEDECRNLQEELELQKSKEERQRALLQLQWKVMDGNQPEHEEVNSKKEYSISSIKMRDTGTTKRSQSALMRPENKGKLINKTDSSFLRATHTPVANVLMKVENVNSGNVMHMPKHSRKVTRREYEVETNNGRTITKRKKTKSTVMFGEPTKHKKIATPRNKTSKDVVKVIKGDGDLHPTNIGDLFTEGSLNPYADDPYAFD